MQDKGLSMLGLAQKAGKTVSGEFSVEKAVKSQTAYLVIVAEDASDNTKKQFADMCRFYRCEIVFYGTKEQLGAAIGKEFRASVAVLDEHLALAIKSKFNLQTTE